MKIRKQGFKRAAALLASLCLLLAMQVTAYAREMPDLTKTGSISVTMTYKGKAVPGGALELYRVGDVSENNGDYGFILTENFAGSRLPLEDITSDTLAEKLTAYASSQKLTGTKVPIGTDGKASVSGLLPGLYLVVQTQAADGYTAAKPFLVSVPMNENGAYRYDVNATPKLTPVTPVPSNPDTPTPDTPTPDTPTPDTPTPDTPTPDTPTPTPDTPTPTPDTPTPTPGTPTPTPAPSTPKLPQTGQLNWPVPVLTVLGLCLFLFGWALRFGKSRECHET